MGNLKEVLQTLYQRSFHKWSKNIEQTIVNYKPRSILRERKLFAPMIFVIASLITIVSMGIALGSLLSLFCSLLILYFVFSKIFGIIPSLDEILKIVNGNKKLFIEIKGIPSEKNLTKLSSLLSSYSGSYTILSFNYNTLKFLSHFFSSYILTFVTSNVFSNEIIELITHEKLFDNIALCHTSVDTKNMEQYVNKKIKIFLYTVNYESDYLILKNKCGNMISGLITDRPLHFINLLKFSL